MHIKFHDYLIYPMIIITSLINLFSFCNLSALPIPVVVITGGARHDYYLIRASFDQSHPHYDSIKAYVLESMYFTAVSLLIVIVHAWRALSLLGVGFLAKREWYMLLLDQW